jgi:hypothetical protein
MADLDLSGQAAYASDINPRLQTLRDRLDERKVIWDKLNWAKRKKWVRSGKDPIMTAAWQAYKYLNTFFNVVDMPKGADYDND